ncbi:hypothetical protein ACKKBG_A06480 [Auxenochlorella protothecoides x Auxenochlorella symbiontica]
MADTVVEMSQQAQNSAASRRAGKPKRKPLTRVELRARAAYRAMEKLLEVSGSSSEHVWSLARVMSAEEYRQLAQERALAGLCGQPTCASPQPQLPPRRALLRLAEPAPEEAEEVDLAGVTCSPACAAQAEAVAQRLGGAQRAQQRFDHLYDAVLERRAAHAAPGAAAVPAEPQAGLAAGSSKVPIMQAHIKERAPAAAPVAPSKAASSRAVEGYVPRSCPPPPRTASERRVHFAEAEPAAAPAAELAAAVPVVVPPKAHFVLEVEDAMSPLEGAGAAAIGSLFGRLRLAPEGGGPGSDGDGEASEAPGWADAAVDTLSAEASAAPSALELTAEQVKGLTSLNPRLAGVLPVPSTKGNSAQEAGEEREEEGDAWAPSDDDEQGLELGSSDDSETELVRGQGPNRPRLTLSTFGLLFTHLEAWVGEATLELLGSGPGAGPASHAPAHDRPAAEALLRLLQAVTPGICAELAIAQLAQVQAALTQLVASFGVRGALPSFKTGQWQLLLIILLKALSMQRAPFLRPAFESREGISRLNAALANRLFTIEEFYAVLELVVVEETQ